MAPYNSMPKWGCERIEAQERFTPRPSHPLQSMVGYDCGHLFASVHDQLVSRYARRLATSSPSCALLAACQASAVSRAENVGRTRPLDAWLEHRLARALRPQGGLLGWPSAGRMGGRGSVADLATPPRTGHALWWGMAVSHPSGGRRSLWPKKGGKASLSPGVSASGLPCGLPRGTSIVSPWPFACFGAQLLRRLRRKMPWSVRWGSPLCPLRGPHG